MTYRDLKFPEGFLWGSAASSHQTEGGNHNNWSEWEKIPGKIKRRPEEHRFIYQIIVTLTYGPGEAAKVTKALAW